MIALGLSVADLAAFEAGLCADHEIRITARLLDLEHKPLAELTGNVLSGQVDVDITPQEDRRTVERSATITLLDPHNAFGVDTDTPQSAGAMANRMLQLFYGVWSQQLPRWVDVPVFTGPITGSTRDGDVVMLTAHGKESLALDACCRNISHRKGTAKTVIIRDLLAAAGETRLEVHPRTDRTTAPHTIASREAIWPRVQSLARSLTGGFALTYDGRGTCRLVDVRSNPVWTFRGGDGGSLLSEPRFTADTSAVKNFVVVTGGIPAGSKKRVQAVAPAAASHPLSPERLGRNGVKRYLREDIVDENITVQEAAQTLANNKLWELLQAGVDGDFDAMVIPHLEPHDYVRVIGEHGTWTMQLTKFSIPLTSDGRMTVGRHWVTRTVNGFRPVHRVNPRIPRPKPKPVPKRGAAKKSAAKTRGKR